jgi:hypothetical protein
MGRIYLIIREIVHKAGQNLIAPTPQIRDNLLQEKLSRPAIYTRAAPFPGEFSALRLASCARQTIAKLREHYCSHGFYNLIEWRVKRADVASTNQTVPKPTEYKTIIDDSNVFDPLIYSSMQQNSKDLAEYLYTVLRLQVNSQGSPPTQDWDTQIYLSDQEIIDHAMQHDLPIFVSIDGSYDAEGIACTTISIVAPDIQEEDDLNSDEWTNRLAKILSAQMQRILINGREVCQRWARQCSIINLQQIGIQNNSLQHDPKMFNDSTHTDDDREDWSRSTDDTNSTIEEQSQDTMDLQSKNRYHFDESMINILDQVLII